MFTSLLKKASAALLGLAGAGMLCAGTSAPQTTFTGSVTLTSNQFDNYFVYDANAGSLSGIKGVGITNPFTGQSNFVPAGTFGVSETVPQYISSGVATAIGLYSPNGVSVAVNQSVYNAALGTETWNQVFAGTQESTIVTALTNGNQSALLSFLNQYSSDFISFNSNNTAPIQGGILHFSTAAAGGSLTFSNITAVGAPPVSSTPEPSTSLLLGAGLSVAGLITRKLRKA